MPTRTRLFDLVPAKEKRHDVKNGPAAPQTSSPSACAISCPFALAMASSTPCAAGK